MEVIPSIMVILHSHVVYRMIFIIFFIDTFSKKSKLALLLTVI